MRTFFYVVWLLTRVVRPLFSTVSLIALILLVVVFSLQFIPHPKAITADVPQQYHLMIKLESNTYAALEPLRKTIPTSFRYELTTKGKKVNVDLEFSTLIAFFGLLMVRFFFQAELWRVEDFAKKRIKPRVRAIPKRPEPEVRLQPTGKDQIFEGEGILLSPEQKAGGTKAKVSMRLTLLTEISKAKRMLETTRRSLGFLAVDVVGSTQMKKGEDEVAIGSSFLAYKRFIESIVDKHGVWKQVWTPDGLMAAFQNLGQAISAGQEILRRLGEFNKNHNQLKTPFSLRLGAHGGELYFDISDNLEEVSDHEIDVTGHLQKEAATNALWTALSDMEALEEKGGFRQTGKKVDGHTIFEWTLTGHIGELLTKDGLISEDQLNTALKEQRRSSRPLGQILIEMGFLEEEDFLQVLGRQLRVPTVKVDASKVESEVLGRLPKDLAERFTIFPLSFQDDILEIASSFLMEMQQIRELEALLGLKVDQVFASRDNIRSAIAQGYGRF